MNKNQQLLGDSVETHQDGLNAGLNSFGSPSLLSSSRVEKCDASTITDQMICNCACEAILVFKEKAHRSFMQVIQIQNLYRQQIQELKKFYEESIKSKDKKFKIKQDLLNQKCKQLQNEAQKIRDYYEKQRQNQIQSAIDEPFKIENIENIIAQSLPDESSESIYNIRQFIQTTNLSDSSKRLERDLISFLTQLKKIKQKSTTQNQIDGLTQEPSKRQEIFRSIEEQVQKVFTFIESMIQNTIQAHQKYNQLVLLANQAESRYNKLHGLYEAGQKQGKFMSEHIKKVSQDKIQVQRKNNQLERTIKNLEQNVNFLKKLASQKQLKINNESPKKDVQCLSNYNPRELEVDKIITNSLLSSKIQRKSNHYGLLTKSLQNNPDKILPRSLNFKKKVGQTARNSNKD